MQLFNRVNNLLSKYMAFWALAIAVYAFVSPPTFKWVLAYIPVLLGIVMFGMGLTLKVADFKLVAKKPKQVLFGVCAQFIIMPLLAVLLVNIFRLPPELAVGVILVGTCPGGTSSNVMTFLARGDVALSVAMTICTTLLAPIVTPFLTLLFAGQWIDIPVYGMFLSIVKMVILPIVLGIFCNTFFNKTVERVQSVLPSVSIVAILFIIAGVVSIAGVKLLEAGWMVLAVVILHNLLGYATGFAVARYLGLGGPQVKAISLEVGMQNSGLATSLATIHFSPLAAIPAVIFSVWHNISGAMVANYLRDKKVELAKVRAKFENTALDK